MQRTENIMPITTCIFDAYGTLFDVNAAAMQAAKEPAQADLAAVWPALARDWRMKQLQYTWLRAVAGRHCDFSTKSLGSVLAATDAPGFRVRL